MISISKCISHYSIFYKNNFCDILTLSWRRAEGAKRASEKDIFTTIGGRSVMKRRHDPTG